MTAALVLASVVSLLLCCPGTAVAADEAKALAEGVRLFEEGRYQAAQEVLVGIDRAKLTPDQQKTRDDTLNLVIVALNMSEKAHRDLQDAGIAIEENELEKARQRLEQVLDNEYAPEKVRHAALTMLEDLGAPPARQTPPAAAPAAGEQEQPVVPEVDEPARQKTAEVDVERARTLTREGDEMRKAGRFDEARRLYGQALEFVPGFPEAVEGLAAVDEHEENVSGSRGMTLADRIRQQDALNWQRTETEYRETERRISQLVSANRFEEAHQLLIRARQIVESGRQFADPVSKYEQLKGDLEHIEKHVRDQERDYHLTEVVRIRRELEEQRGERRAEVERNREREVDSLMRQAQQHRKDGDLPAAIGVLEQVLVIDPRNDPARWLLDEWTDFLRYQRQRKFRGDMNRESQASLVAVEESKIPWITELRYPKNWLEIISREERMSGSQGPLDYLLIGKLDTPVEVDFKAIPFKEVMQRFADNHGINVYIHWNDLVASGVNPNAPVDLQLPQEVTLKKAITMVLEQAGSPTVDLGYTVGDGVLTVATQDWLKHSNHNVCTKMYDITDLLQEIPDFDNAPKMGLDNSVQERLNNRESRPWEYGDDDDDEPEDSTQRDDRAGRIIQLIQDTVAPDSWQDRGGSIGMIREFNNQLVVTQNTASQQQVGNLLSQLREQRAVQVAIEARFITVQSNYLEELGVDLDIVLNQGNAGYDIVQNTGGSPATDPVYGNRLLLPRSFSRYGFLPNTPAAGQALGASASGIPEQPFTHVGMVPPSTGGAINASQMTPIPSQSNVLSLVNPGGFASGVPGTFAGRDTPAFTLFGSFLDNIQVDFLIRATQANARTTLLTAPKLVMSNGQRAWIAVSTQHRYVSTLVPVVAGGGAATAPQTDVANEGAVLDVQATVSADRRYVTLILQPSVTRMLAMERFMYSGPNFFAGAGFVQLPSLSIQQIQTAVNVPDGGTLLIGGQKLAAEVEAEAGVPVLSKIPILKRLYSSRALVKDEQILLILVKPQILIQSEQEKLAFPTMGRRG